MVFYQGVPRCAPDLDSCFRRNGVDWIPAFAGMVWIGFLPPAHFDTNSPGPPGMVWIKPFCRNGVDWIPAFAGMVWIGLPLCPASRAVVAPSERRQGFRRNPSDQSLSPTRQYDGPRQALLQTIHLLCRRVSTSRSPRLSSACFRRNGVDWIPAFAPAPPTPAHTPRSAHTPPTSPPGQPTTS